MIIIVLRMQLVLVSSQIADVTFQIVYDGGFWFW